MKNRIASLFLCFAVLAVLLVIAIPVSAEPGDNPEEDTIRIELPYKLTVEKTGEADPGTETFKFVIDNFGAQVEYTLIQDTVETYGEKIYNGAFIFTIKRSLLGNLSEGFVIRQLKGDSEGWTYDETSYYVIPLFTDNYDRVVGWTFFKLVGDERPDQSNIVQELTFTNSYNAKKPEDGTIRVEIPYILTVKKTGEVDPTKETFRFVIDDFGAPVEYTLIQDTIETDGERTYNGMFIFTIKESLSGNLSEGFVIRQVKGDAEGWTYDETKFYAIPLFVDSYESVRGWSFLKFDQNDEPEYNNPIEEIGFTNSYNAKKPVDPPKPTDTPTPVDPPKLQESEKTEVPKTGDNTMTVLWIALLFVSGGVLTGVFVYEKKKKKAGTV